jgi:hypothetical protein
MNVAFIRAEPCLDTRSGSIGEGQGQELKDHAACCPADPAAMISSASRHNHDRNSSHDLPITITEALLP